MNNEILKKQETSLIQNKTENFVELKSPGESQVSVNKEDLKKYELLVKMQKKKDSTEYTKACIELKGATQYEVSNDEQSMSVLGTKHVQEYGQVHETMAYELNRLKPDCVITETDRPLLEYFNNYFNNQKDINGNIISYTSEEKNNIILNIDPKEVAKFGENIYFAWLATKQGVKDVRYWDINPVERIKMTLEVDGGKKYTPGNAKEWLVTYATLHFYKNNSTISVAGLKDLIEYAMPGAIDLLNLTDDEIVKIIEDKGGASFNELINRSAGSSKQKEDMEKFNNFSDPDRNNFNRDMNFLRDQKALKTFQEARSNPDNKKIIVSAGYSHAGIWQEDLKKIFKK